MIGKHVIADFWLERRSLLERAEPWEAVLREAAQAGRAATLSWHGHQFEPTGATGVLLLSESHLSVHTWPDAGFAALDIFTCGAIDPDLIFVSLFRQLEPSFVHVQFLPRGDEALKELTYPAVTGWETGLR